MRRQRSATGSANHSGATGGSVQMMRDGLCWSQEDGEDSGGRFIYGIVYIVVAKHLQRQHQLGSNFVRQAKTLATYGELKAEARNGRSKKLPEHAGFVDEGGGSSCEFPHMTWSAYGGA